MGHVFRYFGERLPRCVYVYVVSTTNRWIIFPGELERGGAHNEQVDLPHARDVRAD